ncbi:MAG: DMT family transporter [Micromonosporaceae bacterium]|nr:DMT family transporter [Micromonosporaceae bacterium]
MTRDRTAGITLALGAAAVSGVAVFVNSYGVRAVPDATVYTTAKNLVAAVVLAVGAALVAQPWRRADQFGRRVDRPGPRWPRLRPRQVAGLAAVAATGGSIGFVLFFEGLARASSTQAAFLHKTLVIWVALFAVVILRERLRLLHVAAIAVLVAGQAVLSGGLSGLRFGVGEWLVLAATLVWSGETVLASWLLREVPVRYVAVTRIAGGVALLAAWLAVSGRWPTLVRIGGEGWLWATVTGVILAGYVSLWFSALAAAPAVDVTAVLVPAAVVTGVLNIVVNQVAVTVSSATGMLVVVVGTVLAVLAAMGRPALGSRPRESL